METEDSFSEVQPETSREPLYGWEYLPDNLLLHIFQYLTYKDVLRAGLTCKLWNCISRDELFWRNLFYRDFGISRSIGIAPGKESWLSEYKRLVYHSPCIQTEKLENHSDQVLHVSFSHDGKYFATTSKDALILIWKSSYPASIKHSYNMKQFSWMYTQFSQFNKTDTLLLVSGVHFGNITSLSGEIAVFSLHCGDFQLRCRIKNKPYDIFGAWYSDTYLLSGDLYLMSHLNNASVLWLNKASQEVESEHAPIMNVLFRFCNVNASTIRALMVANCNQSSSPSPHYLCSGNSSTHKPDEMSEAKNDNSLENFSSDPTFPEDFNPSVNQCVLNSDKQNFNNSLDQSNSSHCVQGDDGVKNTTNSCNSFKVVESETDSQLVFGHRSDLELDNEGTESLNLLIVDKDDNEDDNLTASEDFSEAGDSETNYSTDEDLAKEPEKLLIFTSGTKTYAPHLVGFKKIKPSPFPKQLDLGLSLSERIAIRDRERAMLNNPIFEPILQNYDNAADQFDEIDYSIDLNGHIIGMALSPDHRYLYVNCRSWPKNYVIENPYEPPPIAQEIDIHVIDLTTFQEVGTMLRSHKAHTPNNECFLIFLDVSDEYVASGAEDKHGYLWDRHYGMCFAKFPHSDVVNSVAFNPQDPEMMVTTSDDFTIKIWRSRARTKELVKNQDVASLNRCVSLSKHKAAS